MIWPLVAAFLVANVIMPGYVCRKIGEAHGRMNAAWWGVGLGWLGVLALHLLVIHDA